MYVVGRGVKLDALSEPTVFPQIECDTPALLRGHVAVEQVVHRELEPVPRGQAAGLEVEHYRRPANRPDPVSGASRVICRRVMWLLEQRPGRRYHRAPLRVRVEVTAFVVGQRHCPFEVEVQAREMHASAPLGCGRAVKRNGRAQ